ncbi:zinc finger and BTB domain-containing protein 11 [Triplophysa rosa]|uniref:Zinc finger and BTB domain-containing protein 11 n=1 Tax=Triplophysa rosa TaxID=992332 RepID=A0A9W8C4Q7_TRIRA|nr:zinc finger and BTB domain-containing protein 11 [Triplophysa rosa]KAI7807656.1 putative zinc finger and BTB domain-containing protein 11 [Triplophysa rosa]
MSNEESYLAIQRYLTDEREPYAPGTHGNTKRKIRKAAACYIVRNGILYYQRRQKGLDEFSELEVVLQAVRRKELITEAHITSGGEHFNQQQTWEIISQKYWWRGILKQVKDCIRECGHCQSKQERVRGSPEHATKQAPIRRKTAAQVSEEEDDDANGELDEEQPAVVDKHELVIVDSTGVVKQFLPKHGQTMLDKLNQQRLKNEFCDITLLIEGEEHRAHKAVLASCSEYFYELFVEKGAVTSHEAVVDLSGFSKASFLPLLDFAYTSNLTFNFCVMAEVATLARHLLMAEVLQICESVHKKVEEQKLMVYQRGDIHTVVANQPVTPEPIPSINSETYVVTMQSDGQVVAHTGHPEAGQSLAVITREDGTAESLALLAGATVDGQTMTVVTHSGQAGSAESLAMVAHSGEAVDGETMTLVTHSGQAGSGESLAVVQACWSVEEPQVGDTPVAESMQPGTYLITVDPGKADASEVVHLAAAAPPVVQAEPTQPPEPAAPLPQEAPAPVKRRPGRPPKVKQPEPPPPPMEDPTEMEGIEDASAADEEKTEMESIDPNKRYLRKRSMKEGSYVRLHMGLENEEEENSSSPPMKIPQKLARRGRVVQTMRQISDEFSETNLESAHDIATAAEESESVTVQSEAVEEGTLVGDPVGTVEGEHVCNECGMVFQRRYALIMHALKHEKTRSFKCSICNKEFQYAASLRAHLARHKHQKTQRGSVTRSTVAENSQESEDSAKYRTKREFVCDICGKTLPKLYSLRIHMLHHTGVRPHSCKVCGKSFATKHSLKMHRALHDSLKRFHCNLCEKSFVTKRSLEEHTSIHTGESKYLCTTCGASFHRASGLSKHLKKHLPKPEVRSFQCTQCDKSFFEAKDLQQHMNKHLGLKPFQCQVCGKCYSWKKDWYSHVKSHTVAEPFRCNVCGKEFFEKALFRRHVKKATHGKKGRVKQNLERECEHCGRKFTQLREYRRHMNNHQGVKPFECLTCGVAWADARSLKRHVRTHTGERPYVCPLCQEAHIDARSLRKHISKFHGDQLPGKIMLEKDTLQFHNQGTQVEHAVSILGSDLPPELQPPQPPTTEEIETVLITEETVEAVQAVSEGAVTTLSDQSIMQVVNYVLAQQAVVKVEDTPEIIQTMEVEVAHVAEVE